MANNMDKLIERIAKEENFTWAKAKEKLNLIYVKMTVADIKSFQDEFTTWLCILDVLVLVEVENNVIQTGLADLHLGS